MNAKINYGALDVSIEDQLKSQGYTLGEKSEFIAKLHKSLTMCMFHLLTDGQYNSALKKLHSKVLKLMKPIAKDLEDKDK